MIPRGTLEVVIAGHAFLVGGDIIISVNGTPLNTPDKLVEIMQGLKVGMTVRLTVFRNGESLEVEYALPERPLLPGDLPGHRLLAPVTGRGVQSARSRGSSSRTW